MAASAIDWTNLGPTLEERIAGGKRPAASTWERIRRALEKYRTAPPVVLGHDVCAAHQVPVAHAEAVTTTKTGSQPKYHGTRARSMADQLPTLAQRNGIGIALDGSVVPLRSGRLRGDSLGERLPTLVADGGRLGLALTVKNNGAVEEAGYRGHHIADALGSVTAHPTQAVLALAVPNRTHCTAGHAAGPLSTVMTSATEGVVVAAAGNTSERPGQTRARSITAPLFTQSTTAEFAVAAMTDLRGGDHTQERFVAEPSSTLAASGNHLSIATAMWSKINGGPDDTAWHGADEPLNTITAQDTTGLVVVPWIEQWESDPITVTEQLATITARLRHTLASIEPSAEPVTDEMMMSVRWRMLEPDPELRRAMAFGEDYILLGGKGQMTAGLGNAVTPPVASWITARCLATLS
jgi:hypothetical protein